MRDSADMRVGVQGPGPNSPDDLEQMLATQMVGSKVRRVRGLTSCELIVVRGHLFNELLPAFVRTGTGTLAVWYGPLGSDYIPKRQSEGVQLVLCDAQKGCDDGDGAADRCCSRMQR